MPIVDPEQLTFTQRQAQTPDWLTGLRLKRKHILVEALTKKKRKPGKKRPKKKLVESILSMMSHEQLVKAGFVNGDKDK